MDGFVFLRSYHESAQLLPNDDRLALYDAICRYALDGSISEDMPVVVKALFISIRPNIDSSLRRAAANRSNGKKGGGQPGNQNALKKTNKNGPTSSEKRTKNEADMDMDMDMDMDSDMDSESKPRRPKPHRTAHGSYQNVMLTDDQLSTFQAEYPTDWSRYVEELSGHIASTGKKYANHLATLRNWAKRDRKPTGNHAPLAPQTDLDHLF